MRGTPHLNFRNDSSRPYTQRVNQPVPNLTRPSNSPFALACIAEEINRKIICILCQPPMHTASTLTSVHRSVSASLSLRDDLQPGLVKCGLADVARDAAASNQIKFEKAPGTDDMDAGASRNGRNGQQVDRGVGVRQHALCFLSRVIHLVADDEGWATEGLISAVVASLEFGGDAEKVGAASVICGIGVRNVGRGLLLRAGALSAAVKTASSTRGDGVGVDEGAVEAIAVLCLDPSAASQALSCGALDLIIDTLGGSRPHSAMHLRCLEAMSSMCLDTSAREEIARRGDAQTALESLLSSPSSALRKRAAHVLASLPTIMKQPA